MPQDPYIGRTIGSYRIEEKLGEGGMGAVYRAVHATLEREAAFKVLPDHLVENNPTFVKRFLVEARAAAKLNHPNIVQVYDAGEASGVYYIAMEFVRGMNARELHEKKGSLSQLKAVEIALQAAKGLSAAKAENIIHRDIKPDNLMITSRGVVKVADFGLAKNLESNANLTATGQILGTPSYMSPEQGEGEIADFRSDIYSLGVTLFELVTDHKPFEAPSAIDVLVMHSRAPVPDPASIKRGLNRPLSKLIQRMMAKKRSNRFSSYQDLISSLTAVKSHLQSGFREDGRGGEGGENVLVSIPEPGFEAPGSLRKGPTLFEGGATKRMPATTKRTTSLYRPPPGGKRRVIRAVLWGSGLFVLMGGLLAVLILPSMLEEKDQESTKNAPAPQEPSKAPEETNEEIIQRLLEKAGALEKANKFDEALDLLSRAMAIDLKPGDGRKADELQTQASVRFDLASARKAEMGGNIDEAVRTAKRAGSHGVSLPRLGDYLARLKGKRALLSAFSPSKSWNEDRKKKIMVKVFNGLSISAREKEFYQRFDEWKMAIDPKYCGMDGKKMPKTSYRPPVVLKKPPKKIPEILKKFPPGKIWNAGRKKKIMMKMLSGTIPTAEEKDFYRRFKEWEKAQK